MLKRKSLLDYTNLFYPNEYRKNDKIILIFSINQRLRRSIALFVESIGNVKILKHHTFSKRH